MTVLGSGLTAVGMDERLLFDQIKRKEADIIHTLQNIAEAAFITESLKCTGTEAEDSEEVDSDLSKVAREIAKSSHRLMDDNSEPDFEDIIDDAVEINDCPDILKTGTDAFAVAQNGISDSKENIPENPQTVIKMDVMEQISNTEAGLHRLIERDELPQAEFDKHKILRKTNRNEEPDGKDGNQEERGEESDPGDSNGSWKIDYIRVETEEKNKIQRKAAVQNEMWSTSKSKKVKTKKRHHNPKRPSKALEIEGRKNKRKHPFSFSSETIASRLDKNYVKLKSKSTSKISQKRFNKKVKLVENWKDILSISSSHGSDLDQVLENVVDSYTPSVPRGTSQACLDSLSDGDLEVFPCPACQDRFLLPTTFFQHITRKSVEISYHCLCCGEVVVFHNKCSLKIHILNHLESEDITRVETDLLDVVSLPKQDLRLNSNVRNVREELSGAMTNVEVEQCQCPECFKSLDRDELLSHFSQANGNKSTARCEDCQITLPTKCSYYAHRRIHKKKPPYICPECGTRFLTWSYYKSHVLQSCLHQTRHLLYVCSYCSSQEKFTAERSEVVLHLSDCQGKQYWKCSLCPSAFVDREKSRVHLADKHGADESGCINVLYKMKYKSQSLFFSSKSSLVSHLEQTLDLRSVFVFSCAGCDEKSDTSQQLRAHLQANPICRSRTETCDALFPPEPEVTEKYRAIMDNLRVIQDETDCSSCLKYNENFQKHVEKHQRLEKESSEPDQTISVNETDETSKRVTRRMKRSRSSELDMGETPSVVKMENSSQEYLKTGSSPPLKLKIRLTPEVSRAVETLQQPAIVTPTVTPTVNPTPTVASTASHGVVKREEKKGKGKGSKVKFSVPEPLVEPLGVDVYSGKDLILLNRLFHSPDAFFSGSVVRAESPRREFRCSQCDLTETDRAAFLSHISQHKSCQSYFQCLECGTCFAAEPSWRKHLLLMHRIKDPGPHLYCQPLNQDFGFSPDEDDDEEEDGEEVDGFEFVDSCSEAGNLVIDTGEELQGHVPTCLACGETFSSSAQFRAHKCGQSPFQGLKLR